MNFDILFISDIDIKYNTPSNFIPIKKTFNDIKERIRERFTEISSNNFCEIENFPVKKLCDLKPMYGFLFQDLLTQYKYWGFGDCDLIYGRKLNYLLNQLHQKNYDVISFRKKWISGSLCILRNDFTCRNLFRQSKDYKKIITEKEHFAFDECGYWHGELESEKISLEDSCRDFMHFTYVCEMAAANGRIQYYHDDIAKEILYSDEMIAWEKEKLFLDSTQNFSSRNEIAYFHYILVKQRSFFFFPKWSNVPDSFFIDNTGFYTKHMLYFKKLIRLFRWQKGAFKALRKRL